MNAIARGFRQDSRDAVSVLLKISSAAAARMEAIQNERADSSAAAQRHERDKLRLMDAIAEHDSRIAELKLPIGLGGKYGLTDEHPQLRTVEAERGELRAKFERLESRCAGMEPAWRSIGRLHSRCERYVLDNKNLAPAKEQKVSLKKGELVADAVARLRQRLNNLGAERAKVAASPLPSATAKSCMRQQVDDLARRGRPDVRALVASGGDVGWPVASHTAPVANVGVGGHFAAIAQGQAVDAIALVCWLHRDVMIEKLDRKIEAGADDGSALSVEARDEKLAQIDAAMLETERDECSLIWSAAATGTPFMFREQADPRAVLGLE